MEYKEAYQYFEEHLKQSDFSGQPIELYEPLEYTLSIGGKRIRPALLLMAGSLFSSDHSMMLDAALGIEMFHNFSLVHDDIMDAAPLRRGHQTVHEKWNRDIAILSGDVMFVKACQLISRSKHNHLQALLRLFFESAVLVCEGQQLDMNYEVDENVSIAQYMEMIEKKTAVLIACSLKMGAILGGADEEDAENLYGFGKNIGIAFQLQDDILDAFADDAQFGKRIGGDIIADKKTFLLLKALELADGNTKKQLSKIAKNTDHDNKVKMMLSLFDKLDIRKLAEQEMQFYFEKGMECLKKVKVDEEKKSSLSKLAHTLMFRKK